MIDLKDLRPATRAMTNTFKKIALSALETADKMAALAAAVGVFIPPPMPEIGDYVRVTEELDRDYGKIAVVYNVINSRNPSLRDVYVMFHPFGGGVEKRRTIGPRDIVILNEMEVIAEAAR